MNRNDQDFLVQKIRTQYTEKEHTGLDELKELDTKVKRPANVFAYIFGSISAIIMGAGMSLVMTDIAEIQKIAKLNSSILTLEKREEIKEVKNEEEGMSEYAQLVANMRSLRREMEENIAQQDENRLLYERVTNEDDREYIKKVITNLETQAIDIRDRFEKATALVQAAEMEFLAKGIIPQLGLQEEETPK